MADSDIRLTMKNTAESVIWADIRIIVKINAQSATATISTMKLTINKNNLNKCLLTLEICTRLLS